LDANRFDALTKRLLTTRLTRVHTLRGIAAAGIAAMIGGRRALEESAAKKHKRTFCHCSASPTNCQTKKKAKKQVKRHLQNHPCDYKGRCQATNPRCPGKPCTSITDCSGGQACVSGFCGTCTNGNQCAAGQGCNAGVCGPCTALNQCASGLICTVGGICVPPPGANCTGNPAICQAPLVCVANICVLPDSTCNATNCTAPRACVSGVCLETCTGAGSGTCSAGLDALCVLGICVAV